MPGRGARATRRWPWPWPWRRDRPTPSPERGRRGVGGREHRGPDRQPAPPAARTADRLRSGPRGAAARRGVEGTRAGGRPAPPRTSPTPNPARPTTSAARERGRGHREVARRPAGACPLARADGGGGARAEARHPPTSPPAGSGAVRTRRPVHDGWPGDPTTRARASAPGRGAAERGERKAVPQLAQHATTSADGRRRRTTERSRGRHGRRNTPGRDPGVGRRDGRGGGTEGKRRADEARLARPPSRRRDDDVTEAVGGRGRAARRREGAVLRTRTRVGRRGTTRGLTARGLQRRGGPAAPRTPTGLSSGPPGATPSRGSRPPPPNTHEPRPARDNTLPARAHAGPPRGAPPHTHAHTHLRRRARLPASGTVSSPPGDAAAGRGGRGGRHPHVGEDGSVPDGRRGRGAVGVGWGRRRAGGGGGGDGDGEGAARTHGPGPRGRAAGRPPGERKGRDTTGPPGKQARGPTATHTHTHEGGPTTPETPAGPSHPGGLPRPGPAARARVRRSPRVPRRDPVRPNSTPPSSPDPPSSESDPRGPRPG